MKPNRNTLIHVSICTILFVLAMVAFVLLDYVDLSVIRAVYLPILIVAVAATFFRQYIFGYIFAGSAVLGLLAEYLIHLSQEHPTMSGPFVNGAIIVVGLILGITMQVIVTRRRRSREPVVS